MEFLPQSLAAMAAYKQFVIFKITSRMGVVGKTDKTPVDPISGYNLKWSDSTKLLCFDDAALALKSIPNELKSQWLGCGIGFILKSTDPFWFFDIDNCLLPCGTAWSPLALQIYSQLNGAAFHVSQSGRGMHLLGCGIPPVHSNKNEALGIEFYTENRLIALTDIHACGNISLDFTTILAQILPHYFPTIVSLPSHPSSIDLPEDYQCPPSDEQLLEWAMRGNSASAIFGGGKASFKELWTANIEVLSKNYPDQSGTRAYDASSADLSLALHLAYWTCNQSEWIAKLMRLSALNRDKYNRGDYLPRTIGAACGRQKDYPRTGKVNNTASSTNSQTQTIRSSHLQPFEYPDISPGKKALETENNLKFLLNTFSIVIRWNNMSRCREIVFPKFSPFSDDAENSALNKIINLAILNNFPITRIDQILDTIAQEDSYHPIADCINRKPWDGIQRLDNFLSKIKTANDYLAHKLIYRWMLGCMQSALSKYGFANPGVLIFKGRQGLGKTDWFKYLDPLHCDAVRSGAILDPRDKDNLFMIASHWITELGEIGATLNGRNGMEVLKAFLSNTVDIARFPYAKKNSRLARRTSFCGSTNNSNILQDTTGNRRFWPIEVDYIDWKYTEIDIQQVWAEVHTLLIRGELSTLTNEEKQLLEESNKQFEFIDPLEERIEDFYNWKDGWEKDRAQWLNATNILRNIGFSNPSKYQTSQVSEIIKKRTGMMANSRRCFLVPKINGS